MNKKPVYYSQLDDRWKHLSYRVKGETATIGGSGCGPTCAAMLIETLTGKKTTPVDTCKWSVDHGYKALNQGTYYSYFKPQFAVYGIDCDILNWTDTYHKPTHSNHDKVVKMLKDGYYIIALMKKGLWTSGGHFIVVYWVDDAVRILDPASNNPNRLNGKISTFRNEVKYYWWVDARKYNKPTIIKPVEIVTPQKKEDVMTGKEIYDALNDYCSKQELPEWAKDEYHDAIKSEITDGSNPMGLMRRYEAMFMAHRAYLKGKSEK